MSVPTDLRYTESHEWVRIEDGVATCGITAHAQEQLGDVVYVDLPEVGDTLSRGDEMGEIESVKAVSSLYAPLSGEVVEVNAALEDAPETVNKDPYGAGWLLRIRLSDASEVDGLLDAAAYEAHAAESDH